jgi:hypothetical protein
LPKLCRTVVTASTVGAALIALFRKCARTPEIKRTATRETLFLMLLWQSMEGLGVEHIKSDLLQILAGKVGFDEARQLIDRAEADWRLGEEAACEAAWFEEVEREAPENGEFDDLL